MGVAVVVPRLAGVAGDAPIGVPGGVVVACGIAAPPVRAGSLEMS